MSKKQAHAPVREGDILAGKYRVERVLGAGAMGVVVAARHLELRELRALKFMLPTALGDEIAVERFFREARAVVRLKSQHVARVHDMGRLDDGAPYIVMEYLEGLDLRDLLKQRGVLSIAEAVGYVLQAGDAMMEAHASGVIHRDLKPANLFLTTGSRGEACIKVLDFGIAKLIDGDASVEERTATSSFVGTPSYMSPEQMRGKSVDARSDLWAIGVILYRMLAGKMPFAGALANEVWGAVLLDEPESPRALRPDLPEELEAAILRCLRKDPEQRFASVAELCQALAPFAPGPLAPVSLVPAPSARPSSVPALTATPSSAPTLQPDGARVSSSEGLTEPQWQQMNAGDGPVRSRKRTRSIVLIAAAAGAILALVGVLARSVGGAASPGETAPAATSTEALSAAPSARAAPTLAEIAVAPVAASAMPSASAAAGPASPGSQSAAAVTATASGGKRTPGPRAKPPVKPGGDDVFGSSRK
jgi:serine/threonine protein kinase